MNEIELNNKLLQDTLKEVVFEKDYFEKLKTNIQSIEVGEITAKDLRKFIYESRKKLLLHLIMRVSELFSYNFNQTISQNQIDKIPENINSDSNLKELKEKNEFLQVLAKKVLDINTQVKKVLNYKE